MEKAISGYCRVLDAPRLVLLDTEEREADCSYAECPNAADCPVGKQITQALQEDAE